MKGRKNTSISMGLNKPLPHLCIPTQLKKKEIKNAKIEMKRAATHCHTLNTPVYYSFKIVTTQLKLHAEKLLSPKPFVDLFLFSGVNKQILPHTNGFCRN